MPKTKQPLPIKTSDVSLAHACARTLINGLLDPSSPLPFNTHSQILSRRSNPYAIYENDIVRFGEEILNETYSPDVKLLLTSLVQNVSTIGLSANSVGKTHAAARAAIYTYLVYPDSQTYTCAAPPEDNLRRLLWGQIGAIIELHPTLFPSNEHKVSLSSMHISSSSDHFITGVTIPASGTPKEREARFSGKHAPHLLFIIDESDAVPPEVFKGIESCMSGGHNRFLAMLNPRQRQGAVYNMSRSSGGGPAMAKTIKLTAFNHPNVISGLPIYPGAVDRNTTVRRINEWTRPLLPHETFDPSLPGEYFIPPSYLTNYVSYSRDGTPHPPLAPGPRRVIVPDFSYMVLAEYPAQALNQLISLSSIHAAQERWNNFTAQYGPNPNSLETWRTMDSSHFSSRPSSPNPSDNRTRPIQGIDVAEMGKDLSASCFRYNNYVAPITFKAKSDPLQVAKWAAAQYHAQNAYIAIVDGNGFGAGVAPIMQELHCNAYGIKVQTASKASDPDPELGEFALLRDEGWCRMAQWVASPYSMLPPDLLLQEELAAPSVSKNLRGKIKVSDNDTISEFLEPFRSPDRATSLMLTFLTPSVDAPGEFSIESYV